MNLTGRSGVPVTSVQTITAHAFMSFIYGSFDHSGIITNSIATQL
jgi:hypothetical protein